MFESVKSVKGIKLYEADVLWTDLFFDWNIQAKNIRKQKYFFNDLCIHDDIDPSYHIIMWCDYYFGKAGI